MLGPEGLWFAREGDERWIYPEIQSQDRTAGNGYPKVLYRPRCPACFSRFTKCNGGPDSECYVRFSCGGEYKIDLKHPQHPETFYWVGECPETKRACYIEMLGLDQEVPDEILSDAAKEAGLEPW